MGKVVTFNGLAYRDVAAGVKRAPITGSDMVEMAAEVIRLKPGASLTESVPAGSDLYLFTLNGEVSISGDGKSHSMMEEAFATIQEGTMVNVENTNGTEATLIGVLAPPPGSPA